MKNHSIYKDFIGYHSFVLYSLFTCLVFSQCARDPLIWKELPKEQLATEYIASNPDQYSEFAKLINLTNLYSTLSLRGPYTILLPTNEAMYAYYKEKKVSSLMDFTGDFQRQLLLNHVFTSGLYTDGNYSTNGISLGALFMNLNAIDDYISSEFHGSDTYLNKTAKIIKRDIHVHNGYIEVIDKVLDPLTKDVYTVLMENPAYKIFSDGLRLTGIKDTLQLISTSFGNCTTRNRYTIYATPDSIYHQFGILNVSDLINWCGASPDDLNSKENSFYRYIEYHCLPGTYYLNQLFSGNFPILSAENNISMLLDNVDYKIDPDITTNKYTGFIVSESNLSAKNGVIHTVNNLLPVFTPKPEYLEFETTDYPDLKQQDFFSKSSKKWFNGEDPLAKIKFKGEYLEYSHQPIEAILVSHNGGNGDFICLSGLGWIELTTPKITKGRWRVGANMLTGDMSFPTFDVYLDGIRVNSIDARISAIQGVVFDEVTWTKSGEHKIKLVTTFPGKLFWDVIEFTPI